MKIHRNNNEIENIETQIMFQDCIRGEREQIPYQPFLLLVSLQPLLVVDGSTLGVLHIGERRMHVRNQQNWIKHNSQCMQNRTNKYSYSTRWDSSIAKMVEFPELLFLQTSVHPNFFYIKAYICYQSRPCPIFLEVLTGSANIIHRPKPFQNLQHLKGYHRLVECS